MKLNPLIFALGQKLLEGTEYSSVRDLLLKEGVGYTVHFIQTLAKEHLADNAQKIADKMVAEKWMIGLPVPKHPEELIGPPRMVHDVLYRIAALFVLGGFPRDFVRDSTDHAIGATLLSAVPTGKPTAQWVNDVGIAAINYGAGILHL